MANQVKGTSTNLRKLVAWDIDEYESFSDVDDCLISLSPRDKYILKNALRQLKWMTRWTSELGTAQPDRDLIAENLAFKLSQDNCMDFCQLMIDCMNDEDSGVADAMINIYNNSDNILNMAQGQGDLALAGANNPTCNKDTWYGGIENLVTFLDINNMDALQIFEVITNPSEWLTEVVAGIFGIKAPVVNSMLEWALFIQDSIQENYEAQWTQAYKDTIVCDLLCIAMENCELTPQQLIDYFYGRLQSQLTFHSLITESLEFLVFGIWTGTEIVDAMILSQLVFRAQFGRWFQDVAFNSIDTDLALGFNNASDDWTLICDDCGFTICFDMTDLTDLDVYDGLVTQALGNPIPSLIADIGAGGTEFPYSGSQNRTHRRGVAVEFVFDSDVTIEKIEQDIYSTIQGGVLGDGFCGVGYEVRDVNDVQLYRSVAIEHTFETWTTYTRNINISSARKVIVFAFVNTATIGMTGNVWLDNFCMTYV